MSFGDARETALSRRYIPAMQRILGEVFFEIAPPSMDQRENTDLVVFAARGGITVAARVRDWSYVERYAHDVTFRSSRPSGAKTELDKVIDGWGDYMLYGFGRDDGDVPRWVLIDLERLRQAIRRDEVWFRGWRGKPNKDGSSKFVYVNANELRARRCVKRHSTAYFPPVRLVSPIDVARAPIAAKVATAPGNAWAPDDLTPTEEAAMERYFAEKARSS